jgi:hypothetical protein
MKIDAFTAGYIECALWSSSAGIEIADDGTVTEAPDDDRSFLMHNFSEDDLAPSALGSIIEECARFQAEAERLLEIASRQRFGESAAFPSYHGHDFWLTRNGHGAGFWDRGYRFGIGEALSDIARSYGSSDMYYADGMIYVS